MKKIKPTYVDFKTAKWLKEKELDYHKIFEDFSIYYDYNVTGEYHRRHYSDFSESVFPNDLWIPIPEQHQVVEWLRINHGIWVESLHRGDMGDFIFKVVELNENNWKKHPHYIHNEGFNSPQEAYSAAFDYIKDNNLI
jgi:hypothetical protein